MFLSCGDASIRAGLGHETSVARVNARSASLGVSRASLGVMPWENKIRKDISSFYLLSSIPEFKGICYPY